MSLANNRGDYNPSKAAGFKAKIAASGNRVKKYSFL